MAITLKEQSRIRKIYSDSPDTIIAGMRYGYISGALKETLVKSAAERPDRTKIIDNYLTNKYLGIPIFLILMWITFYTTFTLGAWPKHWIELLIGKFSELISSVIPSGIIHDFLINGIVAGVGGVVVFLPNILILFFFISFMEDTGYMARAVFIMDKVMHTIGLHGKSFIPLFMGFGCNVPAIMATRIIDSKRDRLLTMLIIPFMSCSARLPVYILFISAFFPKNQSLVLLSLYLTGAIFAIISSFLLKRYFVKSPDVPFVMELPPYRMPTSRSILKHVWYRAEAYFKKIGGVILIASVVIWVLSNFPQGIDRSGGSNKENLHENSMLARIGKTVEPVMRPLGFDWRLSASLLSGLAAKEVVVSTIGIIYQDNSIPGKSTLVEKITEEHNSEGKKLITPLVAFTFMLFILLYVPCAGVIAAIRRESGGWKWALFVVIYTLAAAWIVSSAVYNIGRIIIV
jgi:ferrous iron transport protein B